MKVSRSPEEIVRSNDAFAAASPEAMAELVHISREAIHRAIERDPAALDHRTAHVKALRDCDLARIGRDEFMDVASQHPEIVVTVARGLISRLSSRFMGGKIVVVDVSPDEGMKVDIYYKEFGARPFGGHMVQTPDDYIVPLVSVVSDYDYYKRAGSPSERRTATVRCVTDGQVLVLQAQTLRQLIDSEPKIATQVLMKIAGVMAKRLAAANRAGVADA